MVRLCVFIYWHIPGANISRKNIKFRRGGVIGGSPYPLAIATLKPTGPSTWNSNELSSREPRQKSRSTSIATVKERWTFLKRATPNTVITTTMSTSMVGVENRRWAYRLRRLEKPLDGRVWESDRHNCGLIVALNSSQAARRSKISQTNVSWSSFCKQWPILWSSVSFHRAVWIAVDPTVLVVRWRGKCGQCGFRRFSLSSGFITEDEVKFVAFIVLMQSRLGLSFDFGISGSLPGFDAFWLVSTSHQCQMEYQMIPQITSEPSITNLRKSLKEVLRSAKNTKSIIGVPYTLMTLSLCRPSQSFQPWHHTQPWCHRKVVNIPVD